LDPSGNLFFFDWGNFRARRIDTDGVITTVAGAGIMGIDGDGGPATRADLYSASGIAVDAGGHLYLAQQDASRIRVVSLAASAPAATPTPVPPTPTRASTFTPTRTPTNTPTNTTVPTNTSTNTPTN